MESNRKSPSVQPIGEKIMLFFSDPRIEQIARETKFVQRRSPLTGLLFLKTLVMGYLEKSKGSLSHLAQVCGDFEVSISAQGIDERISQYSVEFLAKVLGYAMQWFQQQCPLVLPILQHFCVIQIVDSTFMELPAAMQVQYPGVGGTASPASLKIQLVFNFLSGQFDQVSLQAGRKADQSYRDYPNVVQAGTLILLALGYFCLDAYAAIMKAQAYFLSRYLYPTALLTPAGERILTELYVKMIACVLFQFLLIPLRIPDNEWAGRELSPVQAHQILSRFAQRLALSLSDPANFCRILQLLLDSFVHFALKQRRLQRPNVCHRLAAALA